jgi:hypothetical protein
MGFNTILYNADYPNSWHIHTILVYTLLGKPATIFSQHIPTTEHWYCITNYRQLHNQNNFDTPITLDSKFVTNANHTKFWGLTINHSMTWKTHIDTILPKLSSACFAIRPVKPCVSHQTLNAIYYLCLFSRYNVIWYNILETIAWQLKGIFIAEKGD